MKSIVKTVAMMALVCVVALKAYNKQSEAQVSDVVLANVEALAQLEGDGPLMGGIVDDGTCYHTITSKAGSQIRYCSTCTFIPSSTEAPLSLTGKCW